MPKSLPTITFEEYGHREQTILKTGDMIFWHPSDENNDSHILIARKPGRALYFSGDNKLITPFIHSSSDFENFAYLLAATHRLDLSIKSRRPLTFIFTL